MVLWEKLLVKARFDFPSATENKLHAIVFKQIQEIKSGKGQSDHDPELTLKPDISKSMASKPPAPVKQKRRVAGRSVQNTNSNYSKSLNKDSNPGNQRASSPNSDSSDA